MNFLRNFLPGYKTHIIAWLMVLIGVVHVVSGDTTTAQFLADPNLILVLEGLGLSALRSAVSKANP